MGAVCDELDNSKLFVHGNVLMTSLMWDRVELWEFFGGQNGLTENERHLSRGTSWALRMMRGSNWMVINHGRLEHGSLGMIEIGWFRNTCLAG